MGETDYNALLYEKVQAEYDSFIEKLKSKPIDQVIESAYEKIYQEVPPRVEYSLSEYGQSLSSVLDILCDWGKTHITHLNEQGEHVVLLCDGSTDT